MAGVIPNVEEQRILTNYVRNSLSLRLYSNDVTPDETSTLASFAEAGGGGYLAKTLLTTSWVYTLGDPTVANYPEQTFTFTGTSSPLYGYYLVDTVTGLLIGAERFPIAVVPFTAIAGSSIYFIPHLGAS